MQTFLPFNAMEYHAPRDSYTPFNAIQTPLHKGINLIEASAGTGKTYAIAMLVLRFVVELDIAIDKVLVVTFTKAATEELKDRVRKRLVEARQIAQGGKVEDETLNVWFEQLNLEPSVIQKRLNTALINIDQAAIFTIHSFCQKVLHEHALESGQLFDAELLDDLSSIKQACVDDFWRKQLYHRTTAQVAILTAHYKTPDELLNSVKDVKDDMMVCPNTEDLDELLQRFAQLSDDAQIALQNSDAVIQQGIADKKFKKGFLPDYNALTAWLNKERFDLPNLDCLSYDGLTGHLDGTKFKTNKTQSSEERKADYLAELNVDCAVFDKLNDCLQRIDLALRRNLIDNLRIQLNERLQHLNVLSFDHLISRLAEALQSDKKDLLVHELQARFQAALIDEFQDTDNHQWFIFSTLFDSAAHFLYLIGDPKQAIYKFRGADIYSYIGAQQRASEKLTLTHNWRSHPKLVDAVNSLFQQKDQPFLLKELAFHPVQAAQTPDKGELHFDNQAIAPMMLWQLAEEEDKHWTKGKAESQVRIAVCNEIIELLNNDYTLQPENRRLQPKDLAILVYTNEQAQDYQNALREVGVPSVLKSTRSVFASHEAKELYRLLNAVANPNDLSLLKQALTISWFGLDGQSLYELFKDETRLDEIMLRFVEYYQDWQKLGLMAMLEKLLGREEIRIKLAQNNRVERQLTNIHHAIELTHQAASDEHLGINKTLDWLQSAIHKSDGSTSETQQLRLESDEDAVQIITMHRSKGLEYAVAFCPCLWQDKEAKAQTLAIAHEHGNIVADLGSPDFKDRAKQAKDEQDAENARLCYVALTRAKYRCYLVWVNARTKEKTNQSALGQLLQLSDLDYIGQQTLLNNLTEDNSFAYQEIPADNQLTGSYKKRRADLDLKGLERSRSLYSNWQMSSYTALSALSEHDTPELPADKAREEIDSTVAFNFTDELPKGAHTGNVIHDLLENHDFYELGRGTDITEARDKACLKYSLKLEHPEIINEVLLNVVQTPLSIEDNEFCLMNIKDEYCLKEMPFYLSLQELNTQKINAILKDSPAYQSLNYKTLSGYLTGFIDLICQYNGKFYVMDYKTNYLLDYKAEHLTLAMREHNYGLQYWLYTVVLHRYLQNRLSNYDYETHFGGVRYLFVRGMQPDIKMSGVYQDMPALEKVEALAELLS